MGRLAVIGNPENRRVSGFVAAARAQGHDPLIVAHRALLQDPDLDLPDDLDVRLESIGEDEEVADLLLTWGHGGELRATPADRPDPRAVFAPTQHHVGFLRYLDRLATRSWTWWTPPHEVARLFDKRQTHTLYREAGIPVPPLQGTPQVVKCSFASSASMLAIEQQHATMTTLRFRDGVWFNSLRVQRVSNTMGRQRVRDFLEAHAPHRERFVPKARAQGAWFDLRVLCIAGEPRFVVMRCSRHPITNLHLGGWRGDLDALREQVPEEAWESAMQTCRDVAALHEAHHLGIDLMFLPRFRGHLVIEANAFGDLLPRLTNDGLDVYGFEVRERATVTADRGASVAIG